MHLDLFTRDKSRKLRMGFLTFHTTREVPYSWKKGIWKMLQEYI